ncbi:ionotropic receptor 75a-like [Anopheles cruzii]|uniref:ionotropic receptor 75a-like n=1 Tax=Anopheles cruzii TaxID=68878 RepID=UPI0022EC75CB|nr:ionotropic receptor 75a-like [Anopheles cruzii]
MAAIFDVYSQRVVDDRKVNVYQIGSWDMVSGLYIWDKRSTYQKRRTFGGITLKGLRLKSALTGANEPSGIIGELLWNSLSVVHNFSIKQHTGLTSNNTSQYDIIINPVEVDRNSGQKFDIIAAVGTSRSVVLFLHPEDAFRRNIFLRPFSLQLWLAVGGLCAATGLLIHKMHHRPPGNSGRHNRSNEDYNISGLSLYVVEIFSQQGFTAPANSYGIRVMLQTIFIFAALLHQFYIAHMVGYLLVAPSKTVTTFRDLVKNEFTIVAENDDDEDLVRLKTASGHAYCNITEGISLIARNRTAFLCDAHRAYSWINRLFTDADRCRLQEIPLVPQRSIYLALAKDSPFKEAFRITLLKITEHGLLHYQRKLWFAEKPECPENGVKMPEVNLDQASGAFWLLLFAGLASSVFLLLEIVIKRSRHGGV